MSQIETQTQTQTQTQLPNTIREAIVRNLGFSPNFEKTYGLDPKTVKLMLYKDAKERGYPIIKISVDYASTSFQENDTSKSIAKLLSDNNVNVKVYISPVFRINILVDAGDVVEELKYEIQFPLISVYGAYKGVIGKKDVAIAFSRMKQIQSKGLLIDKYELNVFKWEWGYKGRQKDVGVLMIPKEFLDKIESDVASIIKKSNVSSVEEEEIEVEKVEEEQKPQKQLELSLPEMELELEEAPTSIPTAVEMRKEEKVEAPTKRELVKIYLLSMRLPSRYLVQKISMEENSNGFVEKREFDGIRAQVASRLEGIRRTAYERISRVFAYVEEFGTWIAVTDEGVKEAQEVSKWIKDELSKIPELRNIKDVDLSKYDVRAISIYMNPEDAKELLQCAIRRISEDLDELERRINEALNEQNKRALARFEKDIQYKKALLEALKSYLSQI